MACHYVWVHLGLRAVGPALAVDCLAPSRPPLTTWFMPRPGHKPWLCSWPLLLRRPCALAAPTLLLLPRERPRPAVTGSTSGLPIRWSSPGAPGRQACAGRLLPSSNPTALNSVVHATPRPQAVALFVASSTATPARWLRHRYCYFRVIALALPLWAERTACHYVWVRLGLRAVRPPLAAPRQLRPDAPYCLPVPAAGFTPEAPQAIVASSTAPPACGLRYRYARTTDSFRFPPSSWLASQSERLAITLGFRLGSGRPAFAGGAPPTTPRHP